MRKREYEIEIVNFEKYNPRKDIKKPSWFAFHNDFFLHPVLGNLSPQELKIWLFMLAERSRRQKKTFRISEKSVTTFCKVYAKYLHSVVKVLKSEGMVKIVNIENDEELNETTSRERNATLQDITLQNNNTPLPPFKGGRRKSKKLATLISTKAICASQKFGSDEEAAKAHVGEDGWKLILRKYAGWKSFCNHHAMAYKEKMPGVFEAQLRNSLQALIEENTQHV